MIILPLLSLHSLVRENRVKSEYGEERQRGRTMEGRKKEKRRKET
jgi:hypothetical protein